MHVTDEQWRLLFSLQFSAKVPAGEVIYAPGPDETAAVTLQRRLEGFRVNAD